MKGWTRFRFTFSCPFKNCNQLICSKSANHKNKNAIQHFKERHPLYNTKEWCLSCLKIRKPDAQHRLNCAKEKDLIFKTQKINNKNDNNNNNVFYKIKSSPLLTRMEKDDEEEEEEISLDIQSLQNDTFPPFSLNVLKLRVITFIFQYLQPNVNTADDKYQTYLKEIFEAADVNTYFGNSIRQLLSFEEGKYFHLVICHVHLKQFVELYHLTKAFEMTAFYCYCNSRNCSSQQENLSLHLHFLTYVPDFERDFMKNVWNKLSSKTKKDRYKKCTRIKTFFHYYNVICYVSEKKACSNRSKQTKHFLIHNPISTREEQLKLLLAYPVLAIRKLYNYSSIQCLQHYDIYYHNKYNYYYSRLDDLFTQIGFYSNVYLTNVKGFDFVNKTTFTTENGTAKDILLKSFGENAYLIWKDSAKEYCKSLFIRKIIQPANPQETENCTLTVSNNDNSIRIESDTVIIKPTKDINLIISELKLRAYNKNVKLYGKRQDIEILKQMILVGQIEYHHHNVERECINDEQSFKIIQKNKEFKIFYEFIDQ